MEIIRKYKTISILVGLIIVFGILTILIKGFNIGGVKTSPEIKISTVPTPIPEPFIYPENINIPSSYMGYAVTKSLEGDLGKAALKYGKNTVDLAGSEWIIKKSKVSEIEYSQIKPLLNSSVLGQLGKQGWAATAVVNASGTQSAQMLTPNLPKAGISEGYVKVYGGEMQEVILSGSRDSLGNVQFKFFVSKITALKDL